MFISHKSNVLQQVAEAEWDCRRMTKGLTMPEYWAWEATISSGDPYPVADYSGETGYTIVECADEDVRERLIQLDDYIADIFIGNTKDTKIVYNIKWSDEKVDGSHFTGDDDAKDVRLLADEWTQIRTERTRLLAETDWMASSDVTLNAVWKTYRQELRDLPDDQSSKTSYADIVWPTKPS